LEGLGLRDEINVSIGTAAVLGLADVRMDAAPTTAYLMLGGRCRMACAFCAQARTSAVLSKTKGSAQAINPSTTLRQAQDTALRQAQDTALRQAQDTALRRGSGQGSGLRLSRITWPPFDEGEVLGRLVEAAARGDFRRVCLQVTAGQDYFRRTFQLVEAVRGVCDLPVDAAILPNSVDQVEALLHAGIEHIGFGLDAACERVFRWVKWGDWERNLELVEEAARRFPGHVAVHLIVGLGETEREMAEMIQRMHDLGVIVGLFAFTPVRGTAMQDQPPPPLDTYRRMQVARHLISHGLATLQDFAFSAEGRLVSFGRPDLAKMLADGVAFQTSGCPDCNRPFYNERPGGPLYNYPRPLTPAEALRAVAELATFETRTSRGDEWHEFSSK
jgi:biotin synthase